MAIDVRVGDRPAPEPSNPRAKRPFLGVNFVCANGAYMRFYKTPDGSAYHGRCPTCLKDVRVGIASHGVDARFFDYDCGRAR